MTIAEATAKILMLIDEDGSTEFNSKIVFFMDQKQREIVTLVKQIMKTSDILSVDGIITVPADFFEIISIKDSDGNEYSSKYITNTTLEVQNIYEDDTFTVQYNAYPAEITSASTAFEVDTLCQDAIVYGVAASLVYDDPELYPYLIGEYDRVMANIADRSKRATVNAPAQYWGV